MAGSLPNGWTFQVWMGSSAYSPAALDRFLDDSSGDFRAVGGAAIILHAGPRGMQRNFAAHAARARSHGVTVYAGFGLDGHDDTDGTVLTAEEKGDAMADVGLGPTCAGVIMDGESAYDGLPTSWANAQVMCARFRQRAPSIYAAHQPWWKPTVHWRFPYEKFALAADEVFPQFYVEDAKSLGRNRWKKLWPVYQGAWQKLEHDRLQAIGLLDPRFETIQGYGHDDVMPDFVDYLMRRPKAIVWGEPFPVKTTVQAMCAVRRLEARGFLDRSNPASANDAILRFQREYNRTARTKIAEDNRAGLGETIPALLAA